jgi:hypothetical protein
MNKDKNKFKKHMMWAYTDYASPNQPYQPKIEKHFLYHMPTDLSVYSLY